MLSFILIDRLKWIIPNKNFSHWCPHNIFRNWPAAQNNFMGTEKFKPFAKVQKVLLVDDFKLILSGTL